MLWALYVNQYIFRIAGVRLFVAPHRGSFPISKIKQSTADKRLNICEFCLPLFIWQYPFHIRNKLGFPSCPLQKRFCNSVFNHIDLFPYCLALQIYIIFVHEFFYIPILCECRFSNNTPKLYV